MRTVIVGVAAALAFTIVPALAQTANPANSPPAAAPTGQNSGAGVPGAAGNKSGPAVKSPSGTSGAGPTDQNNATTGQQDATKVPGMPGNKSGPAVRSPSGSGTK